MNDDEFELILKAITVSKGFTQLLMWIVLLTISVFGYMVYMSWLPLILFLIWTIGWSIIGILSASYTICINYKSGKKLAAHLDGIKKKGLKEDLE